MNYLTTHIYMYTDRNISYSTSDQLEDPIYMQMYLKGKICSGEWFEWGCTQGQDLSTYVPVLEYDPSAYVLLLAGFIAIQEMIPG